MDGMCISRMLLQLDFTPAQVLRGTLSKNLKQPCRHHPSLLLITPGIELHTCTEGDQICLDMASELVPQPPHLEIVQQDSAFHNGAYTSCTATSRTLHMSVSQGPELPYLVQTVTAPSRCLSAAAQGFHASCHSPHGEQSEAALTELALTNLYCSAVAGGSCRHHSLPGCLAQQETATLCPDVHYAAARCLRLLLLGCLEGHVAAEAG